MSDEPKTQPNVSTQNTRRLKYGSNVLIAVLLALVLVGLVNWIGFRRVQPFDFTATRQYTMSPQTISVLKNLKEEYQIVTLLSKGSFSSPAQVDRARDLADEYGRYSKQLSVEHIVPGADTGRQTAFFEKLHKRYVAELEPLQGALEKAKPALEELRSTASALKEPLSTLSRDKSLTDPQLLTEVQNAVQIVTRADSDLEAKIKLVDLAGKDPLPDYAGTIESSRSALSNFTDRFFAPAIGSFERAMNSDSASSSVKEQMTQAVKMMRLCREDIKPALDALTLVKPATEYNRLRDQLGGTGVVVILSPDKVRVIQLDEMFRDAKGQRSGQVQTDAETERTFIGEELITGALASLSLKNQPMIVFVYTTRSPVLGAGGAEQLQHYEQVAQRLRNLNFRVEQWTPGMRMGPMGQPIPPQPEPKAQQGQKTVWVILPVEPASPMSPMPSLSPPIGELLTNKLGAGDSALVMVGFDPSGGGKVGSTDPVLQALAVWGIKPHVDQVVLRQVVEANRQTRIVNMHKVADWPQDLPVSRAVDGLSMVFLQAVPVETREVKDVKVWPLAQISGTDMWAEKNYDANREMKIDPATAADKFVVAVGAQNKDSRLIVVGDPAWATDYAVTYGQMGPGTAELGGALFPGNAELFVNSMYWLSDLDQLIAASPRTQDVRRIEPIAPHRLRMIQLVFLIGTPLVTMILGVSVWQVRRRG